MCGYLLFFLPKIQGNPINPLSRQRERVGVRVDMILPLTFILSPRGEERIEGFLCPKGEA